MTGNHQLKHWLPPFLLILFGVLAYWNSFDGVFIYDDIKSIVDNPHIRVLWPLSKAMSLPLWSSARTVDGRPLLSLTFALNHHLFGPEPWGYHLVNLVIHIGASLLLFGVVRRTLALPQFRERYAGSGRWFALAVALLWLVHPLQTESVTYIVQRAESLMGMLFLLTLYASLRGFEGMRNAERGMGNGDRLTAELRTHPGRVSSAPVRASQRAKTRLWHLAAILACALGMGVKQTMFSVPLLVLLYDYVFIGRLALGPDALRDRDGLHDPLSVARARRARGWFYAALFSTWLIVFGIIGATWEESTVDFVKISPLRYLMTQPLVLLYYLRLSIWPSPLVLDYGWALEDQWARIVFPGLVILGLLAVMFRGIRQRKWYGFVAAWFFLIIAPTSSIAPTRQPIFEHRMYLSLAAVVVLAVIGGEHAIRRACLAFRAAPSSPGPSRPEGSAGPETGPRYSRQCAVLGACLALVVVIVFGLLTHARNRDYHSGIAIWRDNVRHRPNSHAAHNNLGDQLQDAGRYAEAITHYRQVLRIRPDHAVAYYNRGGSLEALGRLREAASCYQQALRLNPDYAEAHNNLGNVLLALGLSREAVPHYLEALRLEPRAATQYNLGNALLALGRPGEAISRYREALRLDPNMADAHLNLANAALALGRPREAVANCREALRLKPGYAAAHYNWGVALEALGRLPEALSHYQQAVRLKPDMLEARINLGAAYQKSGHLADAIKHFEEALRLRPDYAVAQENLRVTREMLGWGSQSKDD